ncbi:hypothetical protein [Streptomyces sp. NPDC058964]|uniref:hypothetical protein n=1 Tax=Streptomyces sp. NPDC058964 TaxID=3346681 RepID=UPI0036AE82C4
MPPDSRPTAAPRLIGDAVPKPGSLTGVFLLGGVGARPAFYAGWRQAASAIGAGKKPLRSDHG